MRIISKFKDYYDIGLGLGVDQSLVYKRETKGLFESANESKDIRMDRAVDLDYYTVGFCGKFYPYVLINEATTSYDVRRDRHKSWYLPKYTYKCSTIQYDLKSTISMLRNLGVDIDQRRKYSYAYTEYRTVEEHFSRTFTDLESVWVDNHTPIFSTRIRRYWSDSFTYDTTIDPKLSDIKFYKVVDPYTAFQEVSMFVGGVLGSSGNPIPEVSERDRFEGKGHDFKKSFRKAPGKNKKKRRNSNG